jgi:hypothetical protein
MTTSCDDSMREAKPTLHQQRSAVVKQANNRSLHPEQKKRRYCSNAAWMEVRAMKMEDEEDC